jgi:Bacterial Ig-like domain (group 3)
MRFPSSLLFNNRGRRLRSASRKRPSRLRLESLEDRLAPATVTWMNPAGGDWDVPGNWSTGKVPTAMDDAVIDVAMPITITHSMALTDQVHSLLCENTLNISAGTLGVSAPSFVTGALAGLTVTGGTVAGPGDLTITVPITWTGGAISGGGTVTASGGATLSGPGPETLDARTLVNGGMMSGAFKLIVKNGGALNNQAGATIHFTDDSNIQDGGGTANVFNNAGTVRTEQNNVSTDIGVTFNNGGTVDAESGRILFGASGSSTQGTFMGGAAGLLNPPALAFSGGYSFQSSTINAGNLAIVGTASPALPIAFTFTQCDVNLGNLLIQDGAIVSFNRNDAQPIILGTLTLNGTAAQLKGSAAISADTFTWLAGTLAGGVPVGQPNPLLKVSSQITIGGPNDVLDGRVLSTFGKVVQVTSSAKITLLDGASWVAHTTMLQNNGTITGDLGVFSFTGDVLVNESGATLKGSNPSSEIHALIENHGLVKPGLDPGVLKNYGGYTQLPATSSNAALQQNRPPTLQIAIAGDTPGVGYDQLDVIAGPIILSGTLELDQVNFVPSRGETFTIIRNDAPYTITGHFDGDPEGAQIPVAAKDEFGNLIQLIYTITYKGGPPSIPGGDGNDVIITNQTPVTRVASNQARVQVGEGKTAVNSGTWGATRRGDTVILHASVGTIMQTGNNANGKWTWMFPTTDGPTQSQTVTITAADQQNPLDTTTTTFSLVVNSLPPTVAIQGAPGASSEHTPITVSASVTDANPADMRAGFTYAWHVTRDGVLFAQSTASSFTFVPNEGGAYVVRLRATDTDGAVGVATPQTIMVTEDTLATVNNVTQAAAELADSAAALVKGAGFKGVSLQDEYDLGSGRIPPDTMGAVGPSQFAEMLNGEFAVYSKTGTLLMHESLDTFWATAQPVNGVTAPRLIYDRRTQRWFASALDVNNGQSNNHLLIAASKTSDPTGQWKVYLVPAGKPSEFATYDTLGADDNGVYFGIRMLPTTGAGSHAAIFATQKAPLIAGASTITTFEFDNITDMEAAPQPAYNFDSVSASAPAWFVSSSTITLANVEYKTLTWNGGTPTLSSTFEVTTPAYGPVQLAPSLGGTLPVDTGDDRLLMATIRNHHLWTSRTVGVNESGTASGANRDAAEFLELDVSTTTATLIQSGRAFDPAAAHPHFFYYPSLMVNGQGYVVVGFSGSSDTQFIGAYAAARRVSDPLGKLSPATLLKAGEGGYTIDFGSGINHWGEYSFTSLDPSDDKTIWTIQEYARATVPAGSPVSDSTSRWGTWIQPLLSPKLTKTTLASSPNPSVFGQPVTFSATVSAVAPATGTPTGVVTFKEGVTVLGSATLVHGTATFSTNTLAVGNHVISAQYNGDSQFVSSAGNDAAHPEVVQKDNTKTAVTSSPNPSVHGAPVTFTATVTALTPGSGAATGKVIFEDTFNAVTTTLGTGTLNSAGNATFSTSSLAIGTHVIKAVYSGDIHFNNRISPAIGQTVHAMLQTAVSMDVSATAGSVVGADALPINGDSGHRSASAAANVAGNAQFDSPLASSSLNSTGIDGFFAATAYPRASNRHMKPNPAKTVHDDWLGDPV